jgi:hypothetical protein
VNKASLDYYEKFFAEKWDSKFVMVRRAEAFLASDTAD